MSLGAVGPEPGARGRKTRKRGTLSAGAGPGAVPGRAGATWPWQSESAPGTWPRSRAQAPPGPPPRGPPGPAPATAAAAATEAAWPRKPPRVPAPHVAAVKPAKPRHSGPRRKVPAEAGDATEATDLRDLKPHFSRSRVKSAGHPTAGVAEQRLRRELDCDAEAPCGRKGQPEGGPDMPAPRCITSPALGGGPARADRSLDELVARLETLTIGPKDWRVAIAELRGSVWALAASPRGTRILQEVLQHADPKEKVALTQELHGHVREAWDSQSAAPHANYVVQKCIEVMPPEHCQFVLDEMLNSDVRRAALNPYGCRVLQRLIEHFPVTEMMNLLNQILDKGILQMLMVSPYGNFVVQCVLEHGDVPQKTQIARVLLADDDRGFARLAENKYASHVVQHAMKHCSDPEQWDLVQKVLRIDEMDPKFKKTVYGSFVISEAKKRNDQRRRRLGARAREGDLRR